MSFGAMQAAMSFVCLKGILIYHQYFQVLLRQIV